MAVRTFYWETTPEAPRRRFSRRAPEPSPSGWRYGNVGDIFNRDLVRHLYGEEPLNTDDAGRRVLLVGSTVHRMRDGDIIAGVGTKGSPQPAAAEVSARIWGARGPLTVDLLRETGHDVSDIRFLLDPGLLIARVHPQLARIRPKRGRTVFIPHYRERDRFADTADYRVIDVDQTPLEFAKQIARAEAVYSSSLHGLVFAHALGRPAALVAPLTAEPELKYRDYAASVGETWRTPGDLAETMRRVTPSVPSTIPGLIDSAVFPTRAELSEAGAIV